MAQQKDGMDDNAHDNGGLGQDGIGHAQGQGNNAAGSFKDDRNAGTGVSSPSMAVNSQGRQSSMVAVQAADPQATDVYKATSISQVTKSQGGTTSHVSSGYGTEAMLVSNPQVGIERLEGATGQVMESQKMAGKVMKGKAEFSKTCLVSGKKTGVEADMLLSHKVPALERILVPKTVDDRLKGLTARLASTVAPPKIDVQAQLQRHAARVAKLDGRHAQRVSKIEGQYTERVAFWMGGTDVKEEESLDVVANLEQQLDSLESRFDQERHKDSAMMASKVKEIRQTHFKELQALLSRHKQGLQKGSQELETINQAHAWMQERSDRQKELMRRSHARELQERDSQLETKRQGHARELQKMRQSREHQKEMRERADASLRDSTATNFTLQARLRLQDEELRRIRRLLYHRDQTVLQHEATITRLRGDLRTTRDNLQDSVATVAARDTILFQTLRRYASQSIQEEG